MTSVLCYPVQCVVSSACLLNLPLHFISFPVFRLQRSHSQTQRAYTNVSRHDIRKWVGMPNAQWSESQRACGALKLIHQPYDGQVAWDWVATQLFSTLISKDGD